VKVSVFSTHSPSITCLNQVSAPNKQAYCDRHGYQFHNLEIEYDRHVESLQRLQDIINDNDVVMMMGCDTAFTNPDIRIEDKAVLDDPRPVISKEEFGNNPINNDVMIWKRTQPCLELLQSVIEEAQSWLSHGWLWQNHMAENYIERLLIHESRYMNSTFYPWSRDGDVFTQIPSRSSWKRGDWVIHALGMPTPATRAEVIKWALGRAKGTNKPFQVVLR
jgi:hypothetical protein